MIGATDIIVPQKQEKSRRLRRHDTQAPCVCAGRRPKRIVGYGSGSVARRTEVTNPGKMSDHSTRCEHRCDAFGKTFPASWRLERHLKVHERTFRPLLRDISKSGVVDHANSFYPFAAGPGNDDGGGMAQRDPSGKARPYYFHLPRMRGHKIFLRKRVSDWYFGRGSLVARQHLRYFMLAR